LEIGIGGFAVSADQLNWLLNLFCRCQLSIAVLVIVSIGLAVVFGMMGIINLAHGEFLMLGAYTTLVGVRRRALLVAAMVLAAATVGVFRSDRGTPASFAICTEAGRQHVGDLGAEGLIMAQGIVLIFGPSTQGIATPTGSLQIGSYSVAYYSLVLVGAAVALLRDRVLGVHADALRSDGESRDASARRRWPPRSVSTPIASMPEHLAFGSALAGAAGALLAPLVGVMPTMGQAYIARAFMTVNRRRPRCAQRHRSRVDAVGGSRERRVLPLHAILWQGALLVLAIVLLACFQPGCPAAGQAPAMTRESESAGTVIQRACGRLSGELVWTVGLTVTVVAAAGFIRSFRDCSSRAGRSTACSP